MNWDRSSGIVRPPGRSKQSVPKFEDRLGWTAGHGRGRDADAPGQTDVRRVRWAAEDARGASGRGREETRPPGHDPRSCGLEVRIPTPTAARLTRRSIPTRTAPGGPGQRGGPARGRPLLRRHRPYSARRLLRLPSRYRRMVARCRRSRAVRAPAIGARVAQTPLRCRLGPGVGLRRRCFAKPRTRHESIARCLWSPGARRGQARARVRTGEPRVTRESGRTLAPRPCSGLPERLPVGLAGPCPRRRPPLPAAQASPDRFYEPKGSGSECPTSAGCVCVVRVAGPPTGPRSLVIAW